MNHWGQVHRPWSHRDRYVGSLVYRESVVPVPMILKDEYDAKLRKKEEIISSLQSIIDRLIKLFESMEGNAAAKVMNNLTKTRKD